MSFELADYPLNKTRSAKHKNSMYYMMRTTRNLTPGDSTGKNLPLIWKTNYVILTSRTYDSKIVHFTFDHRLLFFMWPPLDPPPCYFMYIFGSYRSFVLVVRFVLFRSFCFLISVVSHFSFRFAVSFLHPGCLREMRFSGNTVKTRGNAVHDGDRA